MGHWADKLLPEVKARLKIRGAAKDEVLLKNLRRAQGEIELLAGRRFGIVETAERHIEPGGLPFVDVPDLRIGSHEASVSAWPIPDPVHPETASVLQLGVPGRMFNEAAPTSEALWVAGHLLAAWSANDGLTGATLLWLQERSRRGEFEDLVRRLMEPHRLSFIPVGAAEFNGWWIQLSRRLVVITREGPDEAHLVEPLAPLGDWGVLAAAEPRLIVARLAEHPVTWAMVARVWETPDGPVARPWRHLADAIHRHGLPVLAIDDSTTPDEAGAHLLLVAGWHGYLAHDDDAVPDTLARAYPRESRGCEEERMRRATESLQPCSGNGSSDQDSTPCVAPNRSGATFGGSPRRSSASTAAHKWPIHHGGYSACHSATTTSFSSALPRSRSTAATTSTQGWATVSDSTSTSETRRVAAMAVRSSCCGCGGLQTRPLVSGFSVIPSTA